MKTAEEWKLYLSEQFLRSEYTINSFIEDIQEEAWNEAIENIKPYIGILAGKTIDKLKK